MAARLAELRAARWARVAVRLLALALVALLVLRLRQLWHEHPLDLSSVDVPVLVLAAVLSLSAVVAYGCVWPLILRRLGVEPPPGCVRMFLQSQLGKYLPGSVWHYAGRVGLARSRGVPVRTTMLSLGLEVAASALAALALGVFLLPLVAAVPVAVAIVALAWALSRDRASRMLSPLTGGDQRLALGTLLPTAALYVPVWILYGFAFWLTGRALFAVPADDAVYFTAVFALGWLVGMVAVFAPGGIGVREAVLVALVGPRVGQAEAIVIAAASRILLTGADLAGGGGALLVPRLGLGRVAGAAE